MRRGGSQGQWEWSKGSIYFSTSAAAEDGGDADRGTDMGYKEEEQRHYESYAEIPYSFQWLV